MTIVAVSEAFTRSPGTQSLSLDSPATDPLAGAPEGGRRARGDEQRGHRDPHSRLHPVGPADRQRPPVAVRAEVGPSPRPSSPPRKSPTFSYGPSNSEPASSTCGNATLSYGPSKSVPERTRKSKCSLFFSCRGRLTPLSTTKQTHLDSSNQLHFSVHPSGIATGSVRLRPYRGAHVSGPTGSYAALPDRSHWTATPGPREARTRDELDEKAQRKEPTERPTGDGVHRRGAGDAASRAAHHRPDDRPRPPSEAGVPVHGCAQAASGARGHRLRGRTARPSSFEPHPVRRRFDAAGPRRVAQFCIDGLALAGTRPFAKVFTVTDRPTPKSASLRS